MNTVTLKTIDRFEPLSGWTWKAVEDVIFTGMRAVQKLPDSERRFLAAGKRINWPEVRQEWSDRVNALVSAENDTDRKEAMRGRFTVEGFRRTISQEEIDKIEPAFDLIAMIPERDIQFFQAVMLNKLLVGCGRVQWWGVRESLCISRDIKADSLGKRYRRILQAVAIKVGAKA